MGPSWGHIFWSSVQWIETSRVQQRISSIAIQLVAATPRILIGMGVVV